MKRVVYVCVDNSYITTRVCHVFFEEEDAQEWCLERYRNRYGEDWKKEVEDFGGDEKAFIEYLTSGEAWPYTFHDIDCD